MPSSSPSSRTARSRSLRRATSRRSAAILLLATAALALAGAGQGDAHPAARHAHSAAIVAENAKPGTTAWDVTYPNDRGVEGYTSEPSVRPGETLHFHIATVPANRYRIDIYRLGWYVGPAARLVPCLPSCAVDAQGAPQPRNAPAANAYLNAGWPVTDVVTVGKNWTSGYYLAEPVLTTGSQHDRGDMIPFIVREPATAHSAILVVAAVNTWQAYNWWGGKSLYSDGAQGIANHVSFDRPYARDGFAGAHIYQWEIPMMHFLEREGYDVSYATDVDIDAEGTSNLDRHRLVLVNGHSEYWTKAMRDDYEQAARDATNFAFTGANDAYWPGAYGGRRGTLVGDRRAALDPEPDPAQKTTWAYKLVPPRPECQLLGISWLSGID